MEQGKTKLKYNALIIGDVFTGLKLPGFESQLNAVEVKQMIRLFHRRIKTLLLLFHLYLKPLGGLKQIY